MKKGKCIEKMCDATSIDLARGDFVAYALSGIPSLVVCDTTLFRRARALSTGRRGLNFTRTEALLTRTVYRLAWFLIAIYGMEAYVLPISGSGSLQ
jgi:hypothetical protein